MGAPPRRVRQGVSDVVAQLPDYRAYVTASHLSRRACARAWACAQVAPDARPLNKVPSPLVGEGQGEGSRAAARREMVFERAFFAISALLFAASAAATIAWCAS